MPLPGLTLKALGIVCNQQRNLELEQLRIVVAERDATIKQLRSELADFMSDEDA